ncbi:MAG: hypothetical protein H0U92_08110 [Actinobacteria bacterium]|nr:hypothetical protein [Actinomycetota bacterium]
MTCDELVRSLDTPNKAEWRATVHELLTSLPVSRDALLRGMLDDKPMVRAGCAAALDHADQNDIVEEALRLAARDQDARVRNMALHSLSCAPCKPDGCLVDDSVAILVDALLNDPTIRNRRRVAGELMWGQHGRTPEITAAFTQILADDTDQKLRHRAASYLASTELPREGRHYGEWRRVHGARVAVLELLEN